MTFSLRNLVSWIAFFSLPTVFTPATWSLAAEKSPEEQKPVQITLYPASEPKPALKYQLLPPLIERRPGNAAVWWNRINAAKEDFLASFYAKDGPYDRIVEWMQIPIGDPREKEFRETKLADDLKHLRPSDYFSDMDRAARFETCNWELPVHEGNFIEIRLPEVQQTRHYARMLTAKQHLEIAEGKYQQAVRTLQTGFALARHDAQGPTIIHSLVGTALIDMQMEQVRQFIQQPDAPNLYWALSTLPRPLIDFRPGYEGEYSCLYLSIPGLQNLDKKKLSAEEANKLLADVKSLLSLGSSVIGVKVTIPSEKEIAEKIYPRAKRFLIANGRRAAEVEAMPMAQVVLIASVLFYDQWRDEFFKWGFLPFIEAGNHLEQVIKDLKEAAPTQEFLPLASVLLPAMQAVKHAETRLQWNLAMLRIFEALRLYAANHEGRWPERLSDIKEVPIPLNPYDGKPFIYQRDGNHAVLTSETGSPYVPWRHEITFGRKGK